MREHVSSAHAVELTDAHGETEMLRKAALPVRAGSRTMVLAIVQHPHQNLSTKFRRMSVPSLSSCLLTFALDTLAGPTLPAQSA